MQIGRIPYIWLLNVLLIGVSAFFCAQIFAVWTTAKQSISRSDSGNPSSAALGVQPARRPIPSFEHYNDITQKNLFTELRATQQALMTAGNTTGGPAPATVSGLALFGVVIEGEDKKALMINPENRKNTDLVWVKAGDQVGGYVVNQIYTDRISVTKGGTLFTIKLTETKKSGAPVRGQRVHPKPRKAKQGQLSIDRKRNNSKQKARKRFIPAN